MGAVVDAQDALTTLVAFLTAAGEAYRTTMGHPSRASENQALFPDWVNESAYMNDSELAELALDLGDGPSTGAATAPKTAHSRVPASDAKARSFLAPGPANPDRRPPPRSPEGRQM